MRPDLRLRVFNTRCLFLFLLANSLAAASGRVVAQPESESAIFPRSQRAALLDKDTDVTLDSALLPASEWRGRMLWDADSTGADARDWYLSFQITSREGTRFRGRVEIGADGYAPARSVLMNGEFRNDEIVFITAKQTNFQVRFEGKLGAHKTVDLRWAGTDVHNNKRSGTGTVQLKKPGPATDPAN